MSTTAFRGKCRDERQRWRTRSDVEAGERRMFSLEAHAERRRVSVRQRCRHSFRPRTACRSAAVALSLRACLAGRAAARGTMRGASNATHAIPRGARARRREKRPRAGGWQGRPSRRARGPGEELRRGLVVQGVIGMFSRAGRRAPCPCPSRCGRSTISNGLPRVSSSMVMQPGTGQTCAHRLQPVHSSQSAHVDVHAAWPSRRAMAASRVGARWPAGSGCSPVWMQCTERVAAGDVAQVAADALRRVDAARRPCSSGRGRPTR